MDTKVDTKPMFCGHQDGHQAAKLLRTKSLVPKKGLEPPHPCEYMDLNHARLPIPPLRHLSIKARQACCTPRNRKELLYLFKQSPGAVSNALRPATLPRSDREPLVDTRF